MDWRPVLVGTGVAGGFVALAAAGAFVIVSLAPPERPSMISADRALLMEGASTLRPFDAPAARPREEARVARPVPAAPPPAPLPEPSPASGDLMAMLREDGPPAPLRPAPAAPAAQEGTPAAQRPVRAPRTVLAAAPQPPPQPQLPPETRPPPPAAVPLIRPKPEPPQPEGVLTPAAVRRFHLSLRLTREQEPYWPPVEQALLEIGAQQAAMVKAGQDPKDAFGVGAAMRMYGVARPLLDSLREDQKARVRAQARSMGFASVASQI